MRASRAVTVCGLLMFVSTAVAADTGLRCQLRKATAVGRAFREYLLCDAAGAKLGVPEAAGCVAAVHTRLASKFGRLDATGHCLTTGDAPALETVVDNTISGSSSTTVSTT